MAATSLHERDTAAAVGPAASSQRRLVERAARGDTEAFGRLYRIHLDSVYRLASFHLRDAQTADDLVQDVFVSAFQSIRNLQNPDRFRAWLMRITHNAVKNQLRGFSRAPSLEPLDIVRFAAAAGDNPETVAENRLAVDRIVAASAQLTPLQKQVFGLRFIAGLSVAETADTLDRSPGAVRNLQFHAVAALRKTLSEEEDGR